jgi:hypothetical protein
MVSCLSTHSLQIDDSDWGLFPLDPAETDESALLAAVQDSCFLLKVNLFASASDSESEDKGKSNLIDLSVC